MEYNDDTRIVYVNHLAFRTLQYRLRAKLVSEPLEDGGYHVLLLKDLAETLNELARKQGCSISDVIVQLYRPGNDA